MGSTSVVGSNGTAKPRGFFSRLWKAMRQVFHETVATIFLLLALSWTAAALRLWHGGAAVWMWVIAAVMVLLLLVFSVTSYRSARRVR